MANQTVDALISSNHPKRTHGTYGVYSPELRARTGRVAAELGSKAAVVRFFRELGRNVNESTVRSFKNSYVEAVKKKTW